MPKLTELVFYVSVMDPYPISLELVLISETSCLLAVIFLLLTPPPLIKIGTPELSSLENYDFGGRDISLMD